MKDIETIALIVRGLCAMKDENTYVEFKMNNADPDGMGERISALSNMALLANKPFGYLIWGIDDVTHAPLGTKLSFKTWKKGDQDILAYWRNLLIPSLDLQDYELDLDGGHILVLEIPAASYFATTFKKQAYCRIGSYTKNLKEYPALEKELWQKLEGTAPEMRLAETSIDKARLSEILDFSSYANALALPSALSLEEGVSRFVREGFLIDEGAEHYSLTVLGGLLFAKDFSLFKPLSNKLLRVVRYSGNDRLETRGKKEFPYGYASSFEACYKEILSCIQGSDIYVDGRRKDHYLVPAIAVREALGNILIHQDLLSSGGPLVEIFSDRVEFSNPGHLNVPLDRLIDSAPKPANPSLASFLRRIDIGDTAGSGFDKIVTSLEKEHLPPAKVAESSSGVRVALSGNRAFDEFSSEEKIQAAYEHTVLCHLSYKHATNQSLRERFGLGVDAKYKISRIYAAALEKGKIKKEADSDKKDVSYLPYWA